MIRTLIPFATVLIVPLAAHLGATQALGAHPWWATQIAWIGAALGLGLALLTQRAPARPTLAGVTLLALVAYGAAATGKARFAASFAEDTLAGQVWYFGWIAAAGFAAAALVTASRALRTAPQ